MLNVFAPFLLQEVIAKAKLHDHPARWALEKYEGSAIQNELAGVYSNFLPEYDEDSRDMDGAASLVRFKLVRTEMSYKGRLISVNTFLFFDNHMLLSILNSGKKCLFFFVVPPAAFSTGDKVTDLPRLSQWMNCLIDIVMSPVGYDSREAILVSLEGPVDGNRGDGPVLSLAGKGFSRISAMCFAIIHGAEAVENVQASDREVDDKLQADLDLWKVCLGLS